MRDVFLQRNATQPWKGMVCGYTQHSLNNGMMSEKTRHRRIYTVCTFFKGHKRHVGSVPLIELNFASMRKVNSQTNGSTVF